MASGEGLVHRAGTDFLGIDTRTGNGGNGNWDGAAGTPTYMTLTLSGLSAAPYDWTSYHHDTEHVHGDFRVELSLDGGTNFAQLADGTNDVVFRFAPYSNTAVHRQIWGINGFALQQVPEPSTVMLGLMGALFGVLALLRRRRN